MNAVVRAIRSLFKTPLTDVPPKRYCAVCDAELLNFEWDTFYGHHLCTLHIDVVRGAFDFTQAMIEDDNTARPPAEVAVAVIMCKREELQ